MPSELSVSIQNLTAAVNDYAIEYVITLPSGTIQTGERSALAVAPYLPTTFVLENGYIPTELGTMTIDVFLKSPNKQATYATLRRTFDVTGTHLLNVDVVAPSLRSAQGLTFPFTIHLMNAGDFDEANVQVAWHIKDPNQLRYSDSTFSTTIAKGESGSFPYAAFIPLNAVLGLHALHVEITAYGQTQTREIMFEVSSPNDYYAQVIADLELRADQLEEKLKDLQQRGFDITDEKSDLLDIQTDLAKAKGTFLAGKFENLNTELLDISERLTKLASMIDLIGQQAPLLSRDGLIIIGYAAGILLLLALAYYLWKRLRENAKKGPLANPYPQIPWLMRFMRVDKCYIPLRQRKKQKRKALISRLLGLE